MPCGPQKLSPECEPRLVTSFNVRFWAFMSAPLNFLTALRHCLLTACLAFFESGRLLLMAVRPRASLAAENLFLRKQLALFQERKIKPHRADDATRWLMAAVIRLFNWRSALVVVKPDMGDRACPRTAGN